MTVEASARRGLDESDTTKELLAVVARRLDQRLPEIVRDMRDLLAARIDELGVDPPLLELLQSSIEGNVATICHVLANDIGIESLQPTTAAVEYAVRLAQRDVPLGALTRAYYIGQSMMLRLALDEVEQLEISENARMSVIRGVAETIHRYIDWILQYVSTVHESERRRWWSARATLNAAIILRTLRGEDVTAHAFASATGYDLDQRHVAIVSWLDGDADSHAQHRMDIAIRRVGALLNSARQPLISAADGVTAWAWISTPETEVSTSTRAAIGQLIEASPGIRLSFGLPSPGIDGFRRSHDQAIAARSVALGAAGGMQSATISYGDRDIALMALLLRDRAATMLWMHEVLGAVADSAEGSRVARETLRVYFDTGENLSRTATLLGIHRNTVRQRVARFTAQRSFPRTTDPLEIALALRAYDTLTRDHTPPSS